MRRLAAIAALAVATVSALPAEAQTRLRRQGEDVLILNVRPRSYLDAGNVVPVGSMNYTTSGAGYVASNLNLPPYIGMKDRFGEGVLPDPIQNSPFVGGRNPFGPIDFVAPPGLR